MIRRIDDCSWPRVRRHRHIDARHPTGETAIMARLRLRTSTLPTLTLTVALAWTSGTPDLRAGSAAPPSASDRAETSAAQAQDACTFIPKGELESLVGRELRAGVKKDVPPPMSQCS